MFETAGFRPLRNQLRSEGGVDDTTTASNITLDGKSGNWQAIDATAVMNVILPAEETSNGLLFWISNTGSVGATVGVLTDAPAILSVLSDGEGTLVGCDGTSWVVLGGGPPRPGVDDRVLSGNLSLTAGDAEYQRIDPGGSARVVTLPTASANTGATYHFSNFAGGAENINVGGVVTINQNEAVRVVSDGSVWIPLGVYTIALT